MGQFGLRRDAPKLGPRVRFVSQLEKSCFLQKKTFFAKLKQVYSTAKFGLLRGIQCKAILCILSSRSLTFAIYTHDDFVVLLYTSLTPRSPGTLFLALFTEAEELADAEELANAEELAEAEGLGAGLPFWEG